MLMKKKEEKILKRELDEFLLRLECNFNLFGISPKERYRWDRKKILDEVRSQIENAINLK